MNRFSLILTSLLLGAVAVLAEPSAPTNADQHFFDAQKAYDAGDFNTAVALYSEMISNGCSNVEVLYNLANSHFKNNNLPEAVRRYRQAWHQAPRDPDIRANLGFALNAANAIAPTPSVTAIAAETLSLNEWMGLAAFAYGTLGLLIALAMLIRPVRKPLFKATLIPLTLLLIALAGRMHWINYQQHPDLVITRSGATALYGPVEGSTAHYRVPAAALVRQMSSNPKGWVEIEYDGKHGWLKREYITPVYP